MDTKKIIEISKKHVVSIACGVAALVAIGLVFFLLSGMFEALGTQMESSREAYDTMKQLNGQQFNLPKLDLNNPEPALLVDANDRAAFPTDAAIKAGEKLVKDLQGQSTQLMKLAIQYNRKNPLVRNALPVFVGGGRSNFKTAYYQELAKYTEKLNATIAVTPADVALESNRIWNESWVQQIVIVGGQVANPTLAKGVEDSFNEKVVPFLGADLQAQRAQRFTMYIADPTAVARVTERAARAGLTTGGATNYVTPAAGRGFVQGGVGGTGVVGLPDFSLDYHPGIPGLDVNTLPELMDVWAAQIGLWIQEDVVNAIVQTNDGKRTVHDAIIKRLVRIEIPKEYVTRTGLVPMTGATAMSGMNPALQPAVADMAIPTETDSSAALKREYTHSPTGRVCNSVYDVVHFNVKVDIDPTHYESFIANLTNNRFITILRADLKAIDREEAMMNGFVYSTSPVVQLDLKCEGIFFREWTKELMPKEIKKLLDTAEQQANPMAGGF